MYIDFFCPECANEVSVNNNYKGVALQNTLTEDENDDYIECPLCGTQYLVEITVEIVKEG